MHSALKNAISRVFMHSARQKQFLVFLCTVRFKMLEFLGCLCTRHFKMLEFLGFLCTVHFKMLQFQGPAREEVRAPWPGQALQFLLPWSRLCFGV